MKSRTRILAAVVTALLLWGSSALAEEISGTEPIQAINTRSNTVQLGDRSFELDRDTVIRDGDGNRISLTDLDVPDLGRGGSSAMLSALLGKYVANQRGRHLTLISLDLWVPAE